MSYEDFCKHWTIIGICRVPFRNKYLKQTFDGSFSSKTKTNGIYLDELPQFHLEVKGTKKQEILISFYQSDKRVISNKKISSILIGIRVYKCKGKKVISNGTRVRYTSATWSRESVLEIELLPGEYMIVPYVFKKGDSSNFGSEFFQMN